ncbi:MAG TPA: hypothetical protein VIV40_05750 [Kofleriaceae bacterium]
MPALQELSTRIIDSRKPRTDNGHVARELLAGFYDVCMRSGLDRVLAELAEAHPAIDISDRGGFVHDESLVPTIVAQLEMIDLDDGGPRNAKAPKLTDCLIAGLGLTIADEADRTILLGHDVRAAATSAMAAVVDVELAVPHIRETIIAKARALCEPRFHGAFDRLAKELDERGMRILKQPKIPLDAVQAVQRVLTETRDAVLGHIASTAIDRAKPIIERASPEAAARIDKPITHALTPRDVAIFRVREPRIPKVPAAFVEALVDGVAELSRVAWRAPEKPVRTYGASQTFAVGELIDHPKFGRGEVKAVAGQRIDVEFSDGKHTLVHKPPAK